MEVRVRVGGGCDTQEELGTRVRGCYWCRREIHKHSVADIRINTRLRICDVDRPRAAWLARLFLPSSLVKLSRTVLGGRDEKQQ